MANIMDYLDWRGDLSFKVAGFNEVDNLILSMLAYVDLDGIVQGPESEAVIPLSEASRLFWENHTDEEILARKTMTKPAPFVMRKMAKTKRFGNALLSKYVNDISDREQSQFSVVRITLEDGSSYVAFSGTDDTIVGWRENFNMGYLAETPGQHKAVEYLNRVINREQENIRIGGHSKGGNLSVYAAVKCEPWIQRKILRVFSNDGPGFNREMVESLAYRRMITRIRTILPESSIIGMLLEHQGRCEVVKSSESGILQHDAMTWEVFGPSFVRAEHVAVQSVLVDEAMKRWLYQLDGEERQQIVESVFSLLEEANIKTVEDFYHSKWKKIQEVLKAKGKLPEETQMLFSRAIKLLWRAGNDTVKKQLTERLRK